MMETDTMTDAPPPKPTLDSPLTTAAPAKPEHKARKYEVQGSDEPDAIIRGWVLDEYEQPAYDNRRLVLRLMETEGGAFLALVGKCSDNPGEPSFWTVAPVTTVADAMAAWGNTVAAKKFARQMGWDARRRFA